GTAARHPGDKATSGSSWAGSPRRSSSPAPAEAFQRYHEHSARLREHDACDPFRRYWPPEPAVVGFPTVIAQHEPMARGDPERSREVAVRGARGSGFDEVVGLSRKGAPAGRPAEDATVPDVDFVAGTGHDALDEFAASRFPRLWFGAGRSASFDDVGRWPADPLPGILGRVEHDDVPDTWFRG